MNRKGLSLIGLIVAICMSGMACMETGDIDYPNPVTSPSSGDTWLLGEDRLIEWEADKNDQTIGTLCIQYAEAYTFREGVISSTVPVSSRSFRWRVGVLESGDSVIPGKYRIAWRIPEGPNMWSYSGHSGVFTVKSNR